MKISKKKSPKFNWQKVAIYIDEIIEHYLFRPVAISIIVCFLLFTGFQHLVSFIADHREAREKELRATPIQINFATLESKFDLAEDQVAQHHVKSGETMSEIITQIGVSDQDVSAILKAMRIVFAPNRIVVGDEILIKYRVKIVYDSSKAVIRKVLISNVLISISPEERVSISLKGKNNYVAQKYKIKLERHVSKFAGTINNSLFVDGVDSGVSPNAMMQMINLYGYDVDFQRDIHNGDKFEILVESFYDEEGKKVKDGDILFSSLILQGRKIDAYLYEAKKGLKEYFDSKGNSVRKSLLRTPINGARVSSRYGRRRHPVLGYSRMHKGTDFAAPRGTPIFAAGDGRITHYGRRGSYGKYVRIRHNSKYSTAYAHASRFNRRLRVGSKVKQGDVIAYVGTTGRSTGPHLHFEVLLKGRQINPSKVKASYGVRLKGKKLKSFKATKAKLDAYRKNVPIGAR